MEAEERLGREFEQRAPEGGVREGADGAAENKLRGSVLRAAFARVATEDAKRENRISRSEREKRPSARRRPRERAPARGPSSNPRSVD